MGNSVIAALAALLAFFVIYAVMWRLARPDLYQEAQGRYRNWKASKKVDRQRWKYWWWLVAFIFYCLDIVAWLYRPIRRLYRH